MAKKVKINNESKPSDIQVADHLKALFEQYPHIHTIWVNGNEWYFFEKPGFEPVERNFQQTEVDDTTIVDE